MWVGGAASEKSGPERRGGSAADTSGPERRGGSAADTSGPERRGGSAAEQFDGHRRSGTLADRSDQQRPSGTLADGPGPERRDGSAAGFEGRRPMDRVRDALVVRHYSQRTVAAYLGWIRRFIIFHRRTHPLQMGQHEVAAFLSSLATDGDVSASTQNQALAALVFLYQEV